MAARALAAACRLPAADDQPEPWARSGGHAKLADYLRAVIDAGGYAAHEASRGQNSDLKEADESATLARTP